MDFKNRELLVISCRTPRKTIFSQLHMPVPYNLSNTITTVEQQVDFYNKYFYSRPEIILHGGHNVLIKLENIVFQDIHGKISRDGRYSRAFHSFAIYMLKNFTDFCKHSLVIANVQFVNKSKYNTKVHIFGFFYKVSCFRIEFGKMFSFSRHL